MKVALLCSGLGNVLRGHEVFARDLFTLLRGSLNITLFKGGGDPADDEIVVDHIGRNSVCLSHIRVVASPKWAKAARDSERLQIEGETFAFGALKPLLDGDFDIVHCLEREVCTTLYAKRHLFRYTPRLLWSNGGAIPAHEQPPCDFVQEHTEYSLARSARHKAFLIPHGVDLQRFHPGVATVFRALHRIPSEAFVVITVGTICYWHKRMDHVIREVAAVPGAWLVIVGQPSADAPAIQALGEQLMSGRIVITTLPHDELPQAYAAADVFTLGSLFETFGIVYIEAMAMGLPVVCTDHPNQRAIVQAGLFVDMSKAGALTAVLRDTDRSRWRGIGERGRQIALRNFDLTLLRQRYLDQYAQIAAVTPRLPRYTLGTRARSNLQNLGRQMRSLLPR